MQRRTRVSLVAAVALALVLLAVPTCKRNGGKPVTTTSATATTGTH
jgi:hypothetical protein